MIPLFCRQHDLFLSLSARTTKKLVLIIQLPWSVTKVVIQDKAFDSLRYKLDSATTQVICKAGLSIFCNIANHRRHFSHDLSCFANKFENEIVYRSVIV